MRFKACQKPVWLDRPAWIDFDDGSPWVPCTIEAISPTSVAIVMEKDIPPPPRYYLRLTKSGHPVRYCRTVQYDSGRVQAEIVPLEANSDGDDPSDSNTTGPRATWSRLATWRLRP